MSCLYLLIHCRKNIKLNVCCLNLRCGWCILSLPSVGVCKCLVKDMIVLKIVSFCYQDFADSLTRSVSFYHMLDLFVILYLRAIVAMAIKWECSALCRFCGALCMKILSFNLCSWPKCNMVKLLIIKAIYSISFSSQLCDNNFATVKLLDRVPEWRRDCKVIRLVCKLFRMSTDWKHRLQHKKMVAWCTVQN